LLLASGVGILTLLRRRDSEADPRGATNRPVRFQRARTAMVIAGHQLAASGLVAGTAGNLSIRMDDRVLVTPTGARLDALRPEQLTVVDLADGSVEDGGPEPTSELPLHLAVYRSTGAAAIAHGHPLASIAVAGVLDELPPVHYLTAQLGGVVRVAPYAVFGSAELAALACEALAGRHAALLRNHGSIACGDALEQACDRLELLEWLAEAYCRCRVLGTPALLSQAQLDEAAAELARRNYGR
jgi:L-fuculose-phosphate aldolase